MPRIKIENSIGVSHELFSRLKARGLIDTSGNCTEDFLWYIAECLARDDMRVPYTAISVTGVTTTQTAEVSTMLSREAPVVGAKIEPNPEPVSTAKTISKDQIRSQMSALYKR